MEEKATYGAGNYLAKHYTKIDGTRLCKRCKTKMIAKIERSIPYWYCPKCGIYKRADTNE